MMAVLALLALVALSQGWAGNVLTHTLASTRETFDLSDQGMFDVQAVVRAAAFLGLAAVPSLPAEMTISMSRWEATNSSTS